jgi:DNA-directed RNA polymerase III subunit RPC4
MSPATAMNFLTTAVIVEESDEKPGPDVVGGDGVGMGKVMGRFVLAPVWEDEEEYEIPPEALEIRESS